MININRILKNFGPLEILVLSSIAYVVVMLLWTASTRSEVLQKANDIKSNHKSVVDFINTEVNNCSSNEDALTSWGQKNVIQSGLPTKLLVIFYRILI